MMMILFAVLSSEAFSVQRMDGVIRLNMREGERTGEERVWGAITKYI